MILTTPHAETATRRGHTQHEPTQQQNGAAQKKTEREAADRNAQRHPAEKTADGHERRNTAQKEQKREVVVSCMGGGGGERPDVKRLTESGGSLRLGASRVCD